MSDLENKMNSTVSHFEKELNSLNYSSRNYKDYDKELLLIKDEVIDFLKNTSLLSKVQ